MIRDLIKGHNYRDSLILLEWITGKDRGFLISEKEYSLSEEEIELFKDSIKRLEDNEPIQYIMGVKEFMGLDFYVDENVLIPRFDTEIMVEYILNNFDGGSVLELGLGSAAISVSLKYHNPKFQITGVEISQGALDVARKNAERYGLDVNFLHGDLYGPIEGKFDIIVSNPPYIATEVIETLDENVKREPKLALDGGDDGLDFYRRIIRESPNYLKAGGSLILEIGYDQGPEIREILSRNGYENIEILQDLNGLDRVARASLLK